MQQRSRNKEVGTKIRATHSGIRPVTMRNISTSFTHIIRSIIICILTYEVHREQTEKYHMAHTLLHRHSILRNKVNSILYILYSIKESKGHIHDLQHVIPNRDFTEKMNGRSHRADQTILHRCLLCTCQYL